MAIHVFLHDSENYLRRSNRRGSNGAGLGHLARYSSWRLVSEEAERLKTVRLTADTS